MFNTLKLDRETYEMQNIREAYDPVSARSSSHQACDRCHEKKLKCSGEKSGCDRCVANQLPCQFTRCASRGSRRGKHNRHRSGEPTTARDTSNSSTSSTSTTSSNGSNAYARNGSQRSRTWRSQSSTSLLSSESSTRHAKSTSRGDHRLSPHEHDDGTELILDRIDPELFRLEDGFIFPDLAIAEPSYVATSAADSSYAHATMPTTTSAGYAASSQYHTSSGWFNSVLAHGGAGYPDPAAVSGHAHHHGHHHQHHHAAGHEFNAYQYHQADYRHPRWSVSESG